MKKIILGIVMLTIVVGGYIFYQNNLIKISSTEYYQNLRKECEQKNNKNCCLASVKKMEELGAYVVNDYNGTCNYGYKKEMLKCIGSFAWCEKQSINDTSKFAFYKKLKDRCKETRTDKNQLSCCLDSVKTMEIVGATKLFPGGKYEKDGKYNCGSGLTRMALRCPGSYAWCQTLNNPEGEDAIPVPLNEQRLEIKQPKNPPIEPNTKSIDNLNKKVQLPDNVISEKKCIEIGGEVWNTLGKTSYNGELIGKIEGLKCPCACLIKSEDADEILVKKNGKIIKFTGNLDSIKTFDDCKKAGFKIKDGEPKICIVGEPHMTNGKYKTFYNNPKEVGKTCEDYHYSTCPGSCISKCISSSCGEPDENGAVACTSDCDGEGSCVTKK